MKANERRLLAVEVAKMYYIEKLNQQEIAEKTGNSRANISRILSKCIEEGIVEVLVHDTMSKKPELAHKIQLAYNLDEVIIAPSSSVADRTSRNMGECLAQYLERHLRNGMLLGVSKGRICYHAARYFSNKSNLQVDVIQLQGGTSPVYSAEEGQGLVLSYATRMNGTAYILNAPLMVKSKQAKLALQQSDLIGTILQKYQDLDIAVLEIEQPHIYAGESARQRWLTRADLLQLEELNVAATTCGYFYDEEGQPCNVGIQDRFFAVPLNIIKERASAIGLAMGRHMFAAALGILRSGLLNVLIIDEQLAMEFQRNADMWAQNQHNR